MPTKLLSYQHILSALPDPNFSNYCPVDYAGQLIGHVNREHLPSFLRFTSIFQWDEQAQRLNFAQSFTDLALDQRTEALATFSNELRSQGLVNNWRDELFSIYLDVDRNNEIFRLERGVVPLLALQAHGVHLNGYVMIHDRPHVWIGQRSANRVIAPLKYDQLVAGGLPAQLSLKENLYKEAQEEAGIPKKLIDPAKYVGKIQYKTEDEFGIRNDVLHCYDLELPKDFVPHNQDGEVEQFLCLPIPEIVQLLQKEDQFKPNTALVMLNFLVRHDWISVDDSGYQAIMESFSI